MNIPENPTFCLNMIVKNESRIIERLLKSVTPLIDTYCICDTGSTDNTISIIKSYFDSVGIKGKIVEEKFRDFSYNRNFSFRSCEGMSNYVVLLDADMIYTFGKNFNKAKLIDTIKKTKATAINLFQGNEAHYYYNVRIVKNDPMYEYFEPTHEIMVCKTDEIKITIGKDDIFIVDIGDGGSKSDKFERDVRLLTEDISKKPNNSRSHFYLANSYYCLGKNEEAISFYEKRTKMGGFIQEVWYSHYRMGLCYKMMGQMEKSLSEFMNAYEIMPNRIENLYEIINHYRCIGKNKTAMFYYSKVKEIKLEPNYDIKKDEFLFLHNDIYTYKLDFEYSIIAFYCGIRNIDSSVMTILNNSPSNDIVNKTLQNLKFYDVKLPVKRIIDISNNVNKIINDTPINFKSSSPCIFKDSNGLYHLNVRYVNYTINKENGSYTSDGNCIITTNSYASSLDIENFGEQKFFELHNFNSKKYFNGIEDVRIFKDVNNNFKFIGTSINTTNNICIVTGDYIPNNNILEEQFIQPKFEYNRNCEKNWVFVNFEEKTRIIYSWFPLKICELSDNNILNLIDIKVMPNFFKQIRGSTCGYNYKNEIWFLCHIVAYDIPRNYYHMFAIFDEKMNLLRYSSLFNFENIKIEYALGLIVEDDRVIISYSTFDQTSKIAIYDKLVIDSLIKY